MLARRIPHSLSRAFSSTPGRSLLSPEKLEYIKSAIFVLPFDHSAPADPKTINPDSPLDDLPAEIAGLWARIPQSSKPNVAGTTRIFYQSNTSFAVSSLGDKFEQKVGSARRESIRQAIGSAVKQVRNLEADKLDILVDASLDPHASAVAAHLAYYKFSLKTAPATTQKILLRPTEPSAEWDRGAIYAHAQNFAKTLAELPGNIMTPAEFAERVKRKFAETPEVKITVHDEAWAHEKGMHAFLAVAKGTAQPAKFVEIQYSGHPFEERPVAFVGKGVTFDSGGISIKPAAGMKLMRGDMGGAAAVAAAVWAIAELKLPINVVAVIPLTENMPGPRAVKPGDVVYAMNGKSIEVDNTDAEGRLILADALYYASTTYKPHTVIDVATLTGAIDVALGDVFTGTFSNSTDLWDELQAAGEAEHDRLWRLPLDNAYAHQINSSNADLCNTGGRSAASCTAALFLKSFVDGIEAESENSSSIRWAHLDIAGTMQSTRTSAYQEKGMTGRPVRTLVEWARMRSL